MTGRHTSAPREDEDRLWNEARRAEDFAAAVTAVCVFLFLNIILNSGI